MDEQIQRSIEDAAAAVDSGDLIVYPTETVYGLGANALDPASVERVFELKRRPMSEPLSLAVPDVETALALTEPSSRAESFMRRFLPGPVTVIVPGGPSVPAVLTAGQPRVGIRIPDHEIALSVLGETPPLTATSANRSGNPNARVVSQIDPEIRNGVSAVVDGGKTPGGESTVVDPETNEIIRRGRKAAEISAWLDDSDSER